MKKKKRNKQEELKRQVAGCQPKPFNQFIFLIAALAAVILFAFAGGRLYQWIVPPVSYLIITFFILTLATRLFRSYAELRQREIKTVDFNRKYTEYFLLLVLFSTAFLLKTIGIHESGTDENIYYYGAVLLSKGTLPYRDFFFAHPPLHLIIPAAVFAVIPFNIAVAKMIPLTAFLLSGAFLYLTVREKTGWIKALLALAMYFSCYQVLMASTDMTGINLTTMFCSISLYLFGRKSYTAAGILSGAALMTGLYSAAFVLALFIFAFFISRKSLFSFSAGLAGAFLAISILFLFIGGEGFIQGVFEYHMKKPLKQEGQLPLFSPPTLAQFLKALVNNVSVFLSSKTFMNSLYFHTPYYLAAVIGIFTVTLGTAFVNIRSLNPFKVGESPFFIEKFSLLCTLLFIIQFSLLREVYDFYLAIMMPYLSILLGSVLFRIYDSAVSIAMSKAQALLLGLSLMVFLWLPLAERLNTTFPEEVTWRGERVEYRWKDVVFPKVLAPIVRYLFFADSRIRGEVEPYWRHYIWNKSLVFSKANEIAAYIRENTGENETITGASTIAPLIALYADRRLAAEEVDTNAKRFKSGMITDAEFFRRVCADNLKYLISAAMSYFEPQRMTKDPYIQQHFKLEKEFKDPDLKHFKEFQILLYRSLGTCK